MSDLLRRINELTAQRQELFRLASEGLLPMCERPRLKALSEEIAHLWDEHRREGHPPAVAPVLEEWERPRRGRKPRRPANVDWPPEDRAA